MTQYQTPTLSLSVDRRRLNAAGRSVRHFVIQIDTPEALDSAHERQDQNLAIVIDRSGSMTGHRLEAAKLASLQTLDRLTTRDRLAIVSFDNEARVELASRPMDHVGQAEARAAIKALRPGGSTDLFAGYRAGAGQMAEEMFERGAGLNRVIVLSDGRANCGLMNIDAIAEHASALAERNLFTSTIGIGNGYEARFLQALALSGGGEMHDAEHPDEIAEVLIGEIFGARPLACVSAKLRLGVEEASQLSVVGLERGDVEREGDEMVLRLRLGTLRTGVSRRIVVRARFRDGDVGESANVTATLDADTLEGAPLRSAADPIRLDFVAARDLGDGLRDLDACSIAAHAIRDFVQREAANLNRGGAGERIRRLAERELHLLRRIVKGLADEAELIDDLETIARQAEHVWDERLRKDMEVGAYKSMSCSSEYRSEPRRSWKERMR